jgi:hypothetical protein
MSLGSTFLFIQVSKVRRDLAGAEVDGAHEKSTEDGSDQQE